MLIVCTQSSSIAIVKRPSIFYGLYICHGIERKMNFYRTQQYVQDVPQHISAIIGADIGGTNSNIGVFQIVGKEPRLLFSLHYKSQEVTDFTALFTHVFAHIKDTYNITVERMCVAAAGAVSQDKMFVRPTNLFVTIDLRDVIAQTGVRSALLVNDFEVIGYGLQSLTSKDLVQVNPGAVAREGACKAIIGAGTGLGKCILYFDTHTKRYMPLVSEGGHADFAAQTEQDFRLIQYTRRSERYACNISWENVLSGNGIARIYTFFKHQEHDNSNGIHPHPDEIFNRRGESVLSQKTFEYYTRLYARCAKNWALDALAFGGIFIAGGIAAKNLPMFQLPVFMEEFSNCGKQQELLSTIPIWVIADYNVSLYGAAWCVLLEHDC